MINKLEKLNHLKYIHSYIKPEYNYPKFNNLFNIHLL